MLGAEPSEAARKELKDSFDRLLTVAKAEQTATGEAKIYVNPAGFARTDALTRIGNQVFAVDMENDRNFAQSNAAVRYPQIWDASWFNWVQYNSSISDPLIRNIGEALGVFVRRRNCMATMRAVREQCQYREPQGHRGVYSSVRLLIRACRRRSGLPCSRSWTPKVERGLQLYQTELRRLPSPVRGRPAEDLRVGESQILVAEQTGQTLSGCQRRAAGCNWNGRT